MNKKSNGYWTKPRCATEAKKYSGRKKFYLGCSTAYATARRNNWLDEICTHMPSKQKTADYWTKWRCAKIARKCKNREVR